MWPLNQGQYLQHKFCNRSLACFDIYNCTYIHARLGFRNLWSNLPDTSWSMMNVNFLPFVSRISFNLCIRSEANPAFRHEEKRNDAQIFRYIAQFSEIMQNPTKLCWNSPLLTYLFKCSGKGFKASPLVHGSLSVQRQFVQKPMF